MPVEIQVPTLGSYHCECTEGFTGDDCSDQIDKCSSSPCHNNATCTNIYDFGHFRCICPLQYEGQVEPP
jgi:Notch-like protein